MKKPQRSRASRQHQAKLQAKQEAVGGAPHPDQHQGKPPSQLDLAIAALSSGDLTTAERICLSAIQSDPTDVLAVHLHSLVQFRQGKLEVAIEQLELLTKRAPPYLAAWSDLGNMLHEAKRFPEAIATFRSVIAQDAAQPIVLNNFSVVLKDNGDFHEALAVLRQAIALSPEYLSAWLNLGYCHLKKSEHGEALAAFERAAAISPQNTEPLRVMAQIHRRSGDLAQALSVYQRWLAIEPDCAVAQHMLAALADGEYGDKATADYVREEFDRFADSFDQQLQTLNYRGPQLVVEAIHRRVGSPVAALDVLDGGCGTGAAGQQLRPFARRLIGVDLSTKMLSHARRTSAYDELSELELVQFLELHPQQFDLITIVDTFIYFGELISPLSAAANALKPAGLLFFTVELADVALERERVGFALDTTGRFVHSQAYIDLCLKDAGFVEIETSVIELREERGEPVIGLLVSAQIAPAIIHNSIPTTATMPKFL